MNFSLDQLRALDATVRTGTFAGAARELHRVPSAITYLVHELEGAMGVELFHRHGRRVTLTPEGQRVLEAARDVLDRARALERVAADLAGGWEAELHVVVDGALPMAPLTACLLRFAESDVPTRLRVDVEYQEGVLDPLREGQADLALYLGFDSDADAEAWVHQPLPPMDLVLVAAPSHPLSGRPFERSRAAHHAELVVRDSSARFTTQSKPSFLGSRNVVYLSDFHSKRIALLAGAGWGWVPEHLVAEDVQGGRLVVLQADLARWTYRPEVVHRMDRPLGRSGRLFVETLLANLG
jgi:DNA-binding transcriptional LysR family regulator